MFSFCVFFLVGLFYSAMRRFEWDKRWIISFSLFDFVLRAERLRYLQRAGWGEQIRGERYVLANAER